MQRSGAAAAPGPKRACFGSLGPGLCCPGAAPSLKPATWPLFCCELRWRLRIYRTALTGCCSGSASLGWGLHRRTALNTSRCRCARCGVSASAPLLPSCSGPFLVGAIPEQAGMLSPTALSLLPEAAGEELAAHAAAACYACCVAHTMSWGQPACPVSVLCLSCRAARAEPTIGGTGARQCRGPGVVSIPLRYVPLDAPAEQNTVSDGTAQHSARRILLFTHWCPGRRRHLLRYKASGATGGAHAAARL